MVKAGIVSIYCIMVRCTHLGPDCLHFLVQSRGAGYKLICEIFGRGQPTQLMWEVNETSIGHYLLHNTRLNLADLKGNRKMD